MRGAIAATQLIFLLWAASPQLAAEEAAPVLTLKDAIAVALSHNRLVLNATLETARSEDDLAATKKNRFPSLDVNVILSRLLTPLEFEFEKGVFGTFPGVGPIPDKDTTLEGSSKLDVVGSASISQPLSQLYKIGLGVRAKELALEISMEKSRLQRQSTVSEVTSAYFDIVEARSGLSAREESLRFYAELQVQIEHNVEHETALAADLLDVKARRAKAEYDALVIRNALQTRKERLNMLLARDLETPFEVETVSEADVFSIDEESARRQALERRPEVRQARLQAEQTDFDTRLARAEWIPDLSLSINYIRLFNEQVIPTNIASAGLFLSWDPFDWGRKKHELAQKQRVAEQAANGVGETENSVLVEVGARLRAVSEARALLHAAEANRDAAGERLRLLGSRHREGAALLKDLLQAEASKADAEAQYQQALAALWTARADLDKSIGEDH